MTETHEFKGIFPYQQDALALPVTDLDVASEWYAEHFGMVEVERNGTRIGFSINGSDPSEDGAAILVSNIQGMKEELESRGVGIGNWRIDERDGQKLQVFFVRK